MNGVHDMGGMHGFGPVVREENEPLFHAEWEARVAAINRLTRGPGLFNVDEFRYGIERMDPAHYLRSSYFERWLATVEYNLTMKGYISTDELESRMELLRQEPNAVLPRPKQPASPASTASPVFDAPDVPSAPRFAVGEAVITRNEHPATHTRLPRYARGKRGVIHLVHGLETFPDSHAHGRGKDPKVLYNVRFDGQELWGRSAEPNQTLYLDLWEPYLTPAPAQD